VLPSWRGAAPIQRALIAGDEVVGATTFALEEGLDTGPVFGVMTELVRPTDTAGDLLARVAEGGAGLLVQTLDGIESGTVRPMPQPAEGISLAPKLSVDDVRVDWTVPALGVDRLIRGCTPAPGAWTTFRGERLKLGPVRLRGTNELPPGELAAAKSGVAVGTSTLDVELGIVQPPGKKPMAAADWARGARLEPAERLD
jgi:methionyl-tRNA formyltransferase